MLITLLVVLCLIGYCLGLTRFGRWPIESTPLLTSGLIVTILYFFAYFNQLQFGGYLILAMGISLFVFSPMYIPLRSKELLARYLTPGILFWLILTLIACIFASMSWMKSYDDFHHWGPHAKWTFLNHGFVRGDNYGNFNHYPPGSDLFYYLFTQLNNYSDSVLFIAQNILLMAPLATIFNRSKWSDWKTAAIVLISLFLFFSLVFAFPVGGFHTQLDTNYLIGVVLGGALLTYYYSERKASDIVYLVPILFFLTLLKPNTFPFVLMATTIIALDQFLFREHSSSKIKTILSCFLILITSFFAVLSWQHYFYSVNIAPAYAFHITPQKIHRFFSGQWDGYQRMIVTNFFHHLKSGLINIVPIVLLVVAIFWKLRKNDSNETKRFIYWQVFLSLGLLLYLAGILFLYVFYFVPGVDDSMDSFHRFFCLYLFAWYLFLTGAFYKTTTQFSSRTEPSKVESRVLMASVILLLLVFVGWTYKVAEQPRDSIVIKGQMEIVHLIDSKTNSNARILAVTQWGGVVTSKFQYLVIPRQVEWTNLPDVSDASAKADFLKYASNYDYLLITDADQNFAKNYAALLGFLPEPNVIYYNCENNKLVGCNPKNKTQAFAYLFKIDKQNSKSVHIQKIS